MMTTQPRWISCALAAALVTILGAGCSKEAKKAGHLERANRDFGTEQYPSAEIEYRNVLALDRTNTVAIRNLGHIYYDRGDVPKAFAFLQEAKRLDAADLGVRYKLGLLFLAGGKTNECRAEADFLLKANPGHEGGLQLLVELARSPKQLDDVQKQLQNLRSKLPNQPSVPLALGTLWLRKGDLKAAEADFQKALELNPKSSEAHQGLAHVAFAQKDLKRAEQEYQTSAELAPLRSSVRLRHAEIKAAGGDPEGGRRLLEDLVRKAPDYIPALNRLIDLTFAKKEYDECEPRVRQVLALDPLNFEAATAGARLKMARGQPEKAVEELKRIVQARPRSMPAQYQLALAYLENKDVTNAVASLRQAVELDRQATGPALLLAELYLRRGEFPSAISLLRPLSEPGSGTLSHERVQLQLARAYSGQGNLDEALKLYRQLAGRGSKNPEVPYSTGLILLSQKKTTEARVSFESALTLVPDHLGAVEALVGLDLAEKKIEPATERVKNLMTQHPKAPEPTFLMAQVHAAAGDPTQAEAALKKCLELDPEFTRAYLALAQFYAASKREAEAQKQLTESLSRNPRDRGSLMLLAMVQNQVGRFDEARSTYERLLGLYPDFAPALNNLAFLYAERFKELDKALQLAQKARVRFPENPLIADTYGWILYLRGDPASALNPLRESAAKLSAEPEVRYHLGMAQYMTGDEPGARASLEQALKLKSDLPVRAEAERCLSILAIDGSKPEADALARLERTVAEHPGDPVAARRLAALYESQGAWDRARSTYERLLKASPQTAFALLRLAQLQSERFNDPVKALELARKAREVAPADPQVAFELGRLAYQAGDSKWAVSLLQESRLKNPEAAAVAYELALALYSVSRMPEALAAMQDAVRQGLDPTRSAEAKQFLTFASLFEKPAEAERAASQIQEILGKKPDYAPALMAAAVLYAQKGNPAAAEQVCNRLLQRHPFFAPAHALLARLQSEAKGDSPEAYGHAQKAREILPSDAEVAKTLGIVVYRRGDFARAVDLLKESARIRSQDAEAQYYLGMAYAQLKQKNEARQALNRALELKLGAPLADTARKALSELK